METNLYGLTYDYYSATVNIDRNNIPDTIPELPIDANIIEFVVSKAIDEMVSLKENNCFNGQHIIFNISNFVNMMTATPTFCLYLPISLMKLANEDYSRNSIQFNFYNFSGYINIADINAYFVEINLIRSNIDNMRICNINDSFVKLDESIIVNLYINHTCGRIELKNSTMPYIFCTYSHEAFECYNETKIHLNASYSVINIGNYMDKEKEVKLCTISNHTDLHLYGNVSICKGSKYDNTILSGSVENILPENFSIENGITTISGIIDMYKVVYCRADTSLYLNAIEYYIAHLRTFADSKITVVLTNKNIIRADKAEVVEIYDIDHNPVDVKVDLVNAIYSNKITYNKGTTVVADELDTNIFNRCSHGINGYTSFEDAVNCVYDRINIDTEYVAINVSTPSSVAAPES